MIVTAIYEAAEWHKGKAGNRYTFGEALHITRRDVVKGKTTK